MVTPVSSGISDLGIILEVTPGTTPGAPTYFPRLTKPDFSTDTSSILDASYGGDNNLIHQAVTGPWSGMGSFSMISALDTIGFPLVGVLNLANFTAGTGGAPGTYEICNTGANPTTYSLTDYSGVETDVYPYSVFSELKLSGTKSDGLVEAECKTLSFAGVTGSPPTVSYTGKKGVPEWGVIVLAGANKGSAVSVNAQQWEVTFKREVVAEWGANNSRNPLAIFGTTVDVEGSFTGLADNTLTPAEMAAYRNGTPRYISIQLFPNDGSSDGLLIEFITALYQKGSKVERGSASASVKYTMPFKCVAAPTTFTGTVYSSPVQCTLLNEVPAGTYA